MLEQAIRKVRHADSKIGAVRLCGNRRAPNVYHVLRGFNATPHVRKFPENPQSCRKDTPPALEIASQMFFSALAIKVHDLLAWKSMSETSIRCHKLQLNAKKWELEGKEDARTRD